MNNVQDKIGSRVVHNKIRWMWGERILEDYMDRKPLNDYLRPTVNEVWLTAQCKRRININVFMEVRKATP